MDKAIYTALSGASRVMQEQQVRANNLANISTEGFKADYVNAMSSQVDGEGFESRVHVTNNQQWTDLQSGSLEFTGRDLDVAIEGDGWLALLTDEGDEVYTRAGSLRVGADGVLRAANGMMVSGQDGPVLLPPYEALEIGVDGRISVQPEGAEIDQMVELAGLKLVNPEAGELEKGEDGLFRLPGDDVAEIDPTVSVASGYLEGSNVNAVSEMVSFISLSRSFEMQLKMMSSAETIAEAGDQLLRS